MKLIKYYVGKIFLIAFLLNVQMSASSVSGPSSRSVFSIPHSTTHSPKSNLTANSTIPSALPHYTILVSVIMYSLIFLIGFFGNALVILVVCCNKSLQHNTNYCLVNLSVADLLLIVVCMPSAVMDLYAKEVWHFGFYMCKIIPWLEHTIAHASILTIVAISVERSLAITYPLKAIRMFTKGRLFFVVILIWVISMLFSLPIMKATIYSQAYHKHFDKRVNICYCVFKGDWNIVYLFVSLFLFYMLPCVLLFTLYGKIVLIIRNRNFKSLMENSNSRNVTHHGEDSMNEIELIEKKSAKNISKKKPNNTQNFNQKQIIVLLIIMMFLILLLLLPYRVFSIWTAMATKTQLLNLGLKNYYSILNFCRVTFYINSAINPIFYHILSSKFQNAFKNVLKRKGSKKTKTQFNSPTHNSTVNKTTI